MLYHSKVLSLPKSFNTIILAAIVFLSMGMVTGCETASENDYLSLTTDQLTMDVATQESIAYESSLNPVFLTWMSSDLDVAEVVAGQITAKRAGTVEIIVSARNGAIQDSLTLTVRQPVSNVVINGERVQIETPFSLNAIQSYISAGLTVSGIYTDADMTQTFNQEMVETPTDLFVKTTPITIPNSITPVTLTVVDEINTVLSRQNITPGTLLNEALFPIDDASFLGYIDAQSQACDDFFNETTSIETSVTLMAVYADERRPCEELDADVFTVSGVAVVGNRLDIITQRDVFIEWSIQNQQGTGSSILLTEDMAGALLTITATGIPRGLGSVQRTLGPIMPQTPEEPILLTIISEGGQVLNRVELVNAQTFSGIDALNAYDILINEGDSQCKPIEKETLVTRSQTLVAIQYDAQAPCVSLASLQVLGSLYVGETLQLSVNPEAANYQVQWFLSTDNRSYQPVATGPSFTIPPEALRMYLAVEVNGVDGTKGQLNLGLGRIQLAHSMSEEDDSPPTRGSLFNRLQTGNAIRIPIATAADLAAISSNEPHVFAEGTDYFYSGTGGLDQDYILINDIAISGGSITPIGTQEAPFTGSFDGNHYQLHSGAFADPSASFVGLFGVVSGDVTIQNLTVSSIEIESQEKSGILIGAVSGAGTLTLKNILITNSSITTTGLQAGALVGTLNADILLLENIHSNAYVSSLTQAGLIGTLTASSLHATHLTVSGIVASNGDLGGLAGAMHVSHGDIKHGVIEAQFMSDISVSNVGGLVGNVTIVPHENNLNFESLNVQSSFLFGENIGGLFGSIIASNDVQLSHVEVHGNIYGQIGHVGGVAGNLHVVGTSQIEIYESQILGEIIAPLTVGGIFGHVNQGTHQFQSISVTGIWNSLGDSSQVGGLIGHAQNAQIDLDQIYINLLLQARSIGDQTFHLQNMGGLIGSLEKTHVDLDDSFITSQINHVSSDTAADGSGGLFGRSVQSSHHIQNIDLTFIITSQGIQNGAIGGMFGQLSSGSLRIQQSTQSGLISGASVQRMGGVIGHASGASITITAVEQTLTGFVHSTAGGIIGASFNTDLTLSQSLLTPILFGVSQAPEQLGGFIGHAKSSHLSVSSIQIDGELRNVTMGGLWIGVMDEGRFEATDLSGAMRINEAGSKVGAFGELNAAFVTVSAIDFSHHLIQSPYSTTTYWGGLSGAVHASILFISDMTLTMELDNAQLIGGLAGYSSGSQWTLNDVSNQGSITGSSLFAGGYFGYVTGGSIQLHTVSQNSQVTSDSSAGGLVGALHGALVTGSNITMAGIVNGSTQLGLGFGFVSNSSIQISTASISGSVLGGTANVGGLMGYATGQETLNFTSVTGHVHVSTQALGGGLIGQADNLTIGIDSTQLDVRIQSSGNDIGAFIGRFSDSIGTSELVVINSSITGIITHGGSHVGGLMGGLSGVHHATLHAIQSTVNLSSSGQAHNQVGGLIGYISGASAVVIDDILGLNTISNDANSQDVGGMIGSVDATTVTMTGVIFDGTITAGHRIGGLIGRTGQSGGPETVIAIDQSANHGPISGASRVGGLIGEAHKTIHINQTYNSGTLHATAGDLGGFFGYANGATIQDSYNAGPLHFLTTASDVGGLIGEHNQDTLNINGSYSVGLISGPAHSDLGAFIGKTNQSSSVEFNQGAEARSNYFDAFNTTLNQAVGSGSDASWDLPKAMFAYQLVETTTYADWNIATTTDGSNTWTIQSSSGDFRSYPYLSWQPDALITFSALSLLDDSGFTKITTVAEFKDINNGLSGRYYLGNDLDFSGESFSNSTIIGDFTGVFFGEGHTLKNISLDTSNTGSVHGIFKSYQGPAFENVVFHNVTLESAGDSLGIFGQWNPANPSHISNITVQNITIKAIDGFNVGGLFGTINASHSVTLSNIQISNAYAQGRYQTGLLAGYVTSAFHLENISISGSVYANNPNGGNTEVGGLFGEVRNVSGDVSIHDTNVNVSITSIGSSGKGSNVGGLIGYADTIDRVTLNQITMDGTIDAGNGVGGLIGSSVSITTMSIQSIHMDALDLLGVDNVAGITGKLQNVESFNLNAISATSVAMSANNFVGGLIGIAQNVDTITINESLLRDFKIDAGNKIAGGIGDYSNVRHLNVSQATMNLSLSGISQIGGLIGDGENNAATNITASHLDITIRAHASNSDPRIGGLVGILNPGTGHLATTYLTHITLNAILTSPGDNVGGFLGVVEKADVHISNIASTVSLSGINNVGGIVGLSNGNTLSISNIRVFNSTLSASGNNLGGLIGKETSPTGPTSIENVIFNRVTISGIDAVGGLLGFNEVAQPIIVSNITTTQLTVAGGDKIGGLIGHLNSSGDYSIFNTQMDVILRGNTYIGGLIGDTKQSIDGSLSQTSINVNIEASGAVVGGLIGRIWDGSSAQSANTTFYDTYVTGSIKVDDDALVMVGGLIGEVDNFLTLSLNQVTQHARINVTGAASSAVGGLIGHMQSELGGGENTIFSVKNSVNHAAIHHRNRADVAADVGGLIGEMNDIDHTQIERVQNQGHLAGTFVGGLIGHAHNSDVMNISQAANQGLIDSHNDAGGIIGWVDGVNNLTIAQSSNSGNFDVIYAASTGNGTPDAGGLIAYLDGTVTITDSLNRGNITGDITSGTKDFHVGGLIGRMDSNATVSIQFVYHAGTLNGVVASEKTLYRGLAIGTADGTVTFLIDNVFLAQSSLPLYHGSPTVTDEANARILNAADFSTETYSGWNETIWNLTADPYPTLIWMP